MRLYALIVAGAVIGAVPSWAEDPEPSAGRYQIAPDKDGFVRLDTETGAMSHCVKREGSGIATCSPRTVPLPMLESRSSCARSRR
jgi:hypothetical protein